MTDQLRKIAEAKAQIAFPVPELHMLKEIRKERRIGYVEGFIAAQPVLDLEKVAAVIDREFDDYQPMYPADGSRCIDSNAARALCEAAKRGELS